MTMPPTQFKATGPVFADAVPESGVVNLTIAAPSVNSCAQFELTPARADALAHDLVYAAREARHQAESKAATARWAEAARARFAQVRMEEGK